MKRLVFALCLLVEVHMLFAQAPSGIINVKYANQKNDTTIIQPDPPKPKPEKTPKAKKERKKIQIDKSHPIATGWRGFAEVALSINAFNSYESHVGFDALVTYGYQLTHWLYLGAGGGLFATGEVLYDSELSHCYDPLKTSYHDYDYTMILSIPLYGNARFYCLNTKIKPFFDIKMGGMIPLHNRQVIQGFTEFRGYDSDIYIKPNHTNFNYDEGYIRYGGFFTQIGLGVEYKQYFFSFNYGLREVHQKFFKDGQIKQLGKYINASMITFNFGYNF